MGTAQFLLMIALAGATGTTRTSPMQAPADPLTAASVAELKTYRAVLETQKGNITIEFLPEKAPETVRQFLRLAAAEVFDITLFHRVLPGNLIQTGAEFFRQMPLNARQKRLVHNIKAEINDTAFGPGVVAMARDDAPDSAQTSFFICVGPCKENQGKYTVFARVVSGMQVARAISLVPNTLERPKEKLLLMHVSLTKSGAPVKKQ